MGRNRIVFYVTLLGLLCLLLSVGGVFATWYYSVGPAQPGEAEAAVLLQPFTWKPQEILPTDQPGENYLILLDAILNNNKMGLNSGKGSALEAAVKKADLLHSSANIQGGNLKFITDECRYLDFVLHYISATEMHVYMFESSDADSGTVDVTVISAYKTILKKSNGKWSGEESQLGYGVLRNFDGFRSVLPEEWIRGTRS